MATDANSRLPLELVGGHFGPSLKVNVGSTLKAVGVILQRKLINLNSCVTS